MTIDIKITSDETIERKGKQYRPVAIRSPKQNEKYLTPSGNLCIAGHGFSESVYVILEEVIPPYRTPTDEDAKQRPMAEFWDENEWKPHRSVLLAVSSDDTFPFVEYSDGCVTAWEYCRIPNEKATNDNL